MDKPPRSYMVGDEIRLRVSFTHRGNVEEVRALYALDDSSVRVTITLAGGTERTENLETQAVSGWRKRSEALLLYSVTEDNVSGLYRIEILEVRGQAGGP